MNFNKKLSILSILSFLFFLTAFSQVSIRIPIRITETFGTPPQGIDTIQFGFSAGATYGIDTVFGERQLPPPPPTGLYDVRFINIPSRGGQNPPAGLVQGTKIDVRNFHSGVDTFRIQWQTGNGTYPMNLSWPEGLSAYADSIRIIDEGGGIFVSANMTTTSSLTITNDIVTSLLIFFYPRPLAVRQAEAGIPSQFSLSQNFPNPFNPSTIIHFSLPTAEFVVLKVYNLLGKEITTLVNENKQAGTYTVKVDLSGLPSGMYLMRINAGKYTDVKKIVLMK
jgi:hypothetical protein